MELSLRLHTGAKKNKTKINSTNTRKVEIISCILLDRNVIILKTNNKRSSVNSINSLRLNNTLLNHEGNKLFLELNENDNTPPQSLRGTLKAVLTEAYSSKCLNLKRAQINDLRIQLNNLEK